MILEIQATMPSPPATLKPYMNGVYIAYGIVSWCYCEGTPSFFAYNTMLPACPALFVSLPAPCLPGQAQAQAVCHVFVAVSVAFAGYWAYGFDSKDNVLFTLKHPAGVIALASAMVLVHVLGSYQVRPPPPALAPTARERLGGVCWLVSPAGWSCAILHRLCPPQIQGRSAMLETALQWP